MNNLAATMEMLPPDPNVPLCDECSHPVRSERYSGMNRMGAFTLRGACRVCKRQTPPGPCANRAGRTMGRIT